MEKLENVGLDKNPTFKNQRNVFLIAFISTLIIAGTGIGVFSVQASVWKSRASTNSLLASYFYVTDTAPTDDSFYLDYYYYVLIEYEYNFGANTRTIKAQIPDYIYLEYKFDYSHDPPGAFSNDWRNFVTYNDPYIESIADTITSGISGQENIADTVLHFVQDHGEFEPCIHYVSEIGEFPKYPIETLVESCGDCEDQSILYASLMKSLGYNVVLLLNTIGTHMMVGIHLDSQPTHNSQNPLAYYINFYGKKYYFAETTAEGWRVGDLPPELQGYSWFTIEIL